MTRSSRLQYLAFIAALLAYLCGSVATAESAIDRLDAGDVLLLRHAIAPGFGDPDGFRIDDCATQRNLSDAGRRQAITIGTWLKARGVANARVYSSQWCRCLETARLLGLGDVTPLPGLNSFFQRPDDRDAHLAALRRFLAEQGRQREPLILVTHQVTVTALTGVFPSSGEGVIASVQANGTLKNAERVGFGE